MKAAADVLKSLLKRLLGIRLETPLFLFRHAHQSGIGNLQSDEALFLYGIIRVLRPKRVVEFGFLNGYSATVILSAMNGSGQTHSYDISDYARQTAIAFAKKNAGFFYHHKSQADFASTDVESLPVDFVLMDGAHDLQMNIDAFQKIKPLLSNEAVVMVHDTGLWHKEYMKEDEYAVLPNLNHKWLDDQRLSHQIDERRFVNWVMENESDWTLLHFGSPNTLRHGFSLIGRRRLLDV